MDHSRDTAIRVLTKKIAVTGKGEGSCFSWIKANGITIVSIYISPSLPQEDLESRLDDLSELLRTLGHTKVVLAGDFNAKATDWGNRATDPKGAAVQAWAAANNLCCTNIGNKPTFQRAESWSIIDLTFTTEDISNSIQDWSVLDKVTLSDHNCIGFTVGLTKVNVQVQSPLSWKFREEDSLHFQVSLCEHLQDMDTNSATAMSRATQAACAESLRARRPSGKLPLPWWTKAVAEAHTACSHERRAGIRSRWADPLSRIRYNQSRGALRYAIKEAKREYWQSLLRDLNKNPWGAAYEIVTKKLAPFGTGMDKHTTSTVLTHLFPVHRPVAHHSLPTGHMTPFSEEELKVAVSKMKSGRSGGPDGIPVEAVKLAVKVAWPTVLRVMNSCLANGIFPPQWKYGRVVLVYKAGKPPGAPNAYRPICLLDAYGKMLEHLISARLTLELDRRGAISVLQFGFTLGRSTVDAIRWFRSNTRDWSGKITLVLLLDVKNAFNSASWQKILDILRALGIDSYTLGLIQSYLNNRVIIAECTDGRAHMNLTSGVPQGSVLGPLLWNILYNGVLELTLPEGCERGAYADDFAAFITGKDIYELKLKAESAYARIAQWFQRQGLELAHEKTEAIIVCGKRRIGELSLDLCGSIIVPSPRVKYLGVYFNRAGNFSTHASLQAGKAAARVTTLSRLMSNVDGPTQTKRLVIASAVTSIMLYAAPVWAPTLKKTHWVPLARVHRSMALRICSAYRTVSEDAALLIAGTAPLQLQALKASRMAEGMSRADAERLLRNEWQELWDTAEAGAWTRTLIPDIGPWLDRKHGEVDFFVTQFLSGHGAFREYLYRFKRVSSPQCSWCNGIDSAKHCILECPRWSSERRECFTTTGYLGVPEIIPAMLSGSTSWEAVTRLIKTVLQSVNHYY